MKKLLVMMIAALAISAHSASVQWNTGSLKQPTNNTGAWGGTSVVNGSGYALVWFFTSAANANDFVASGYTDGTKLFASTVAGDATTKDTSAAGGIYNLTSANSFTANTTYFTVAYAETTLTGNVDPFMNQKWYTYTSVGTFTVPGTGNAVINYLSGSGLGGSSLWSSSWTPTTPVPEPATGMMALAGVAMLIRRRRRA